VKAAFVIRDEKPDDIAAIRQVIEEAFSRRDEADLVDRLRADGDCVISKIAVDGGIIAGHILFSELRAPFRALALAPLAVASDRQRSGIGSQLVRTGLECAAKAGWQAVFVLGEPDYYGLFGFDVAQASGFASLYAGPYFMVLALAGDLPSLEGEIKYPPAFAALG
jgi:putative acetyltransferase